MSYFLSLNLLVRSVEAASRDLGAKERHVRSIPADDKCSAEPFWCCSGSLSFSGHSVGREACVSYLVGQETTPAAPCKRTD